MYRKFSFPDPFILWKFYLAVDFLMQCLLPLVIRKQRQSFNFEKSEVLKFLVFDTQRNYAFLFLFLQSPKTHTDDTGETFDETGLHKFAKIYNY